MERVRRPRFATRRRLCSPRTRARVGSGRPLPAPVEGVGRRPPDRRHGWMADAASPAQTTDIHRNGGLRRAGGDAIERPPPPARSWTDGLRRRPGAAVCQNERKDHRAEYDGQQHDPRLHGLSFRFESLRTAPATQSLASAARTPTYCCVACRSDRLLAGRQPVDRRRGRGRPSISTSTLCRRGSARQPLQAGL